jgi:hypothetical protein
MEVDLGCTMLILDTTAVADRDEFMELLIGETGGCGLAKDERGVRKGGQGLLALRGVGARLGRLCGRSGVKVHVVIRRSRVESLKVGVSSVA